MVDDRIARVGLSKRATIDSQEGGEGVGIRGEEDVLRKLYLCKVFVEGNRRESGGCKYCLSVEIA